jgi:hypothetical protein
MQSKWRRLQRSADDAVSSPGRRVEARRLDGRRRGTRRLDSAETCTEMKRVRQSTTRARGDGREVTTTAKAERKRWCDALTGEEARATASWHARTQAVGSGVAVALDMAIEATHEAR